MKQQQQEMLQGGNACFICWDARSLMLPSTYGNWTLNTYQHTVRLKEAKQYNSVISSSKRGNASLNKSKCLSNLSQRHRWCAVRGGRVAKGESQTEITICFEHYFIHLNSTWFRSICNWVIIKMKKIWEQEVDLSLLQSLFNIKGVKNVPGQSSPQ